MNCKQNKHGAIRRILAFVLTAAIVFSILPAGIAAAAPDSEKQPITSDTYEDLGLAVSAPDLGELDEHPYGTGRGMTPLLTMNELMLYTQTRDDQTGAAQSFNLTPSAGYTGNFLGSPVTTQPVGASEDSMQRPVAVGADLTGKGKKDVSVVMRNNASGFLTISIKDGDSTSNALIDVVNFLSYTDSNGNLKNIQTEQGINPWMSEGVYQMVAGNFDGEPGDEIAVYVPRVDSNPRVLIYKYISGRLYLWAQFLIPSEFYTAGRKADTQHAVRALPTVSLSAGDITRNGRDELTISVGASVFPEKSGSSNRPWKSHDSKLFILDERSFASVDSNNTQVQAAGEITLAGSATGYEDATSEKDKKTTDYRFNVVTPGAGIGDVTGDKLPDIVVAGRFGDRSKDDPSEELYAVSYVAYDQQSSTYALAEDWQLVFGGEYDIDTAFSFGSNWAEMWDPITVATANIDGDADYISEVIFVEGQLLRWQRNGSISADYPKLATDQYQGGFSPYDNSSMVGDNTDQNAVYLTSSSTDSYKWIQQVAVGNFNNNIQGKEQIVYLYGKRAGGFNTYYWDMGLFGGEKIGGYQANVTGSSTVSGGYACIASCDTDDDSMIARFVSKRTAITAPEILAVLVSPPYFTDLASSDGYDVYQNSVTEFGKYQGSSTEQTMGTSLSVGVFLDFSQNGGAFGLKILQVVAGASFDFGFTIEHMFSEQTVEGIAYGSGGGTDSVAVIAIPVTEYTYDVFTPEQTVTQQMLDEYGDGKKLTVNDKEYGIGSTVPGYWQKMTISEPGKPAHSVLNVDTYDAIASKTEGMTPLRGTVVHSTPGVPDSYIKENSSFKYTSEPFLCRPEGTSYVSKTFETESAMGTSFNYSLGISGKIGGGAGGLSYGTQGSTAGVWGNTTSSFEGTTYTSTVYNLPTSAIDYGFTWQFGLRDATLDGKTFPVLDYVLTNVSSLPRVVQDLSVTGQTSNSIDLVWSVPGHSDYPANGYLLQRWDENTQMWKNIAKVGGDGREVLGYTDTRLLPLTSYQYRLISLGAGDTGSIESLKDWDTWNGQKSKPSLPVEASTYADESTGPQITSHPQDVTVKDGQSASFSVTAGLAPGTVTGELIYQWYQVDTFGARAPIDGADQPTLTLDRVEADWNGYEYYCEVTQYILGKKATAGSNRAMLSVNILRPEIEVFSFDDNRKPIHFGQYFSRRTLQARVSFPEGMPAPEKFDYTITGPSGKVMDSGTLDITQQQDWLTGMQSYGATWSLKPNVTNDGVGIYTFTVRTRADDVYSASLSNSTQYAMISQTASPGDVIATLFTGLPDVMYYGDTAQVGVVIIYRSEDGGYTERTESITYLNPGQYFEFQPTYPITFKAIKPADNLEVTAYVSGGASNPAKKRVTILPRPVTISAGSYRIDNGDPLPEFQATASDPLFTAFSDLEFECAEDGNVPGRYAIKPKFKEDAASAELFRATFKNGSLNVVGVNYTVTYGAGPNGSITAESASAAYGTNLIPSGEGVLRTSDVAFTAAPADRYAVKSWTVNGQVVTDSGGSAYTGTTYTVDSLNDDLDVQVAFERSRCAVEYGVYGEHGALSATAGGGEFTSGTAFLAGTALVFTASPEEGYIVDSWWVNGVQVPGEFTSRYSMTLTEDTDVKVKFRKEETYTVTASVSEKGTGDGELTLTCNGQPLENGGAVPYGATVVAAVEPDHSLVDYWKVNGIIYAGSDVYAITIEGISEDTEIVVELSHESGIRPPSLKRADVELLGAPFVYSGSQIKPEIKVSDRDTPLTEGVDYAVSYGENINAGKDAGTITLTGMGDYAGGEKTVSFTIEKAPGAVLPAPSASGAPLADSITVNPITASTGQSVQYAIALQGDAPTDSLSWQDGTTFGGLTEYTDYYVYARALGNSNFQEGAPVVSAAIRTADATAPTGIITIKTNQWKTFLNTISFGLFFKDAVEVEITAQDAHSGVQSISYFLSDAALPENTDWNALQWTEYTNPFNLQANWKGSVYARILDHSGNETVLNSEGVVVYSDAKQGTQSIHFTKTETSDVTANVILNGNTLRSITNGDATLDYGTDYILSGNEVTFYAEYLDSLAAGDYTFTLSFNPLGEEYISGEGNEEPATIHITLTVDKAPQPSLSITGLSDRYVYGDAPFRIQLNGAQGTGEIRFSSSDPSVAAVKGDTVTILKAGTFAVTATIAEDDNYEAGTVTSNFVTVKEAAPGINLTAAPSSGAVYGDSVTLTATLQKPDGGVPFTGTITFKEGDFVLAADVELDSSGAASHTIAAPGAGNHDYTAVYSGRPEYYAEASAGITGYNVEKAAQAALAITGTPDTITYGDTDFSLETSGGSGSGGVTFTVPDDNGVIQITPDGVVSVIGAGTVSITATKSSDDNYNEASAIQEIQVQPRDISQVSVVVTGSTVYTGKGLQPEFTVEDGELTICAADYAIAYGENRNAGTNGGSITLTGQGNYTGEKTIEFDIAKAPAPVILWPTASALDYGQALSESVLSGGDTQYGDFAWEEPDTVPTIINNGYNVIFTPNANTLANYENIAVLTQSVAVTVHAPKIYPVSKDFGEWTGSGSATAIVDADSAGFVRLLLNDQEVDPQNYTASQNPIVLTLKESYLNTLGNGTYQFTAEFKGGTSGLIALTVNKPAGGDGPGGSGNGNQPNTGEEADWTLWLWLGATTLVILNILFVGNKRRNRS